MTDSFQRSDAHRFLARLVPPTGHYLEVRTIETDGPAPRQSFCSSIEEALRVIERWSGRANVYVGACPRIRCSGTKEDVNSVLAFWSDLDFHHIHPDRGRAEAIVLDRLRSCPRSPSMIVLTGNGAQGWWLLQSPIVVSEEWPVERIEGVNLALARQLGGDHVQDLARVLRVPGTMNLPTQKKRERGCVPAMARLVLADGPTHDPSSFPSRPVPAVESPRNASRGTPPLVRTSASDREVVEAFETLLVQLGSRHPLTRSWRGERTLNDSSRSGWDMALVNQLFRAGVREEFIPSILRAFRHGRGAFATESYVIRTIAKGRASRRSRHESQRSA